MYTLMNTNGSISAAMQPTRRASGTDSQRAHDSYDNVCVCVSITFVACACGCGGMVRHTARDGVYF